MLKDDSHALSLPRQLLFGCALPWAFGLLAVPEQLSVQHDLTGIIFFEEVDAAEQGGLSTTAPPNQREDFTRANGEVDAAQDLHRAKRFSYAANLDHAALPQSL